MKNIIKYSALKLIQTTHILLILYIITGWVCNYTGALFFHIISCLLLLLNWLNNNQKCLITQLENKIKGKNESDNKSFVSRLLANIGLNLSEQILIIFVNIVVIISACISLYKLINQYQYNENIINGILGFDTILDHI